MSGIRTNAAAELLGVSPNTLAELGAPLRLPQAAPDGQGGHRQYDLAELEALRRALLETHNISSAIEVARQRGEGPSSAGPPARRLRPLRRVARPTASWRRASPSAPSSARSRSCCCPALELAARPRRPRGRVRGGLPLGHRLAARRAPRRSARGHSCRGRPALRLEPAGSTSSRCTCRRSSSPCGAPASACCCCRSSLAQERVSRAMRALDPAALVVCGSEATLDVVGRLVYAVRQIGSAAPVFEYREAMPVTGNHAIPSLGAKPIEAAEQHEGDRRRRTRASTCRDVSGRPRAEARRAAAAGAGARSCRSSGPAPSIARAIRSEVGDPLAHRALEALVRAESDVRRSARGGARARTACPRPASRRWSCSTTAGGELELRTLRRRLGWSQGQRHRGHRHARAARGLVTRRRLRHDRRAMAVRITAAGAELVERLFPAHADRVSRAFAALDEDEKRSLAELCRKLAA